MSEYFACSSFAEGVNDGVDSCPMESILGGLLVFLSCVNVLVWPFVCAVDWFWRWKKKIKIGGGWKKEEGKKFGYNEKHLVFVHSHFMSNRNRSPPVCFIFVPQHRSSAKKKHSWK